MSLKKKQSYYCPPSSLSPLLFHCRHKVHKRANRELGSFWQKEKNNDFWSHTASFVYLLHFFSLWGLHWLILYVNVSHSSPGIWLNAIFGVPVYFWMRIMCDLVGQVKQIVLPNMGGPHLIHWSSEYKKRWSKEEFTLSACHSAEISTFSCHQI